MAYLDSYKKLCEKETSIYTSAYCEENIWKLFEKLKSASQIDELDLYAVFISNDSRVVPIYYQTKSEEPDSPVLWDYHVIAIHKDKRLKESFVYDFDTTLEFPVDFKEYISKAIKSNEQFLKKYHRFFRVVPAKYYLENFASDRSHMIKPNGEYNSPPPSYSCIQNSKYKNNIQEFISMKRGEYEHGKVMTLDKLIQFFTSF